MKNSYRICTYNIHSSKGMDGKYNVGRIRDIIYEIDPDIIGLQEVYLSTLNDSIVADNPSYEFTFIPTLERNGKLFGNALITKHPILQKEEIKLDHSSLHEEVEKRTVIYAKIQLGGLDTALNVFVSHVDTKRKFRNLQGEKLIHEIHRVVDLKKENCLVLMDFNEWFFSSSLLRKMRSLFPCEISFRSFPTLFPVFKLDRIWCTTNIKIEESGIYKTEKSKLASDHFPLFADIKI